MLRKRILVGFLAGLWIPGGMATAEIAVLANSVIGMTEASGQFVQAIQEALQDHPEVRKAIGDWRERRYVRDEVAAAAWPQVNVGFENRSDLLSAEREAYDRGDRLDAVVNVSQQVYDFGALGARKAAAATESSAAYWNLVATREAALYELVEIYYAVRQYRALSRAAADNLQAHEELTEKVRSRVTAGAGSSADLLRAESQAVSARATLIGFQGQLEGARNRFIERFGVRSGELPLPPGDWTSPFTGTRAELSDWQSHPEYRSVDDRFKAAGLSLEGVEKSALPSVSLNLQGRRFDVNQPERAENDLALIVSVNYDLFNGGADRARAGQAQSAHASLRAERSRVLAEIRRRAETAWSEMDISQRHLDATRANVDSNEQVITAFRKQFDIGTRSLRDLLDAQDDLFQSRRNEINARFERDMARYRYLQSVGRMHSLFDITMDDPGEF